MMHVYVRRLSPRAPAVESILFNAPLDNFDPPFLQIRENSAESNLSSET